MVKIQPRVWTPVRNYTEKYAIGHETCGQEDGHILTYMRSLRISTVTYYKQRAPSSETVSRYLRPFAVIQNGIVKQDQTLSFGLYSQVGYGWECVESEREMNPHDS
jgi:hypothetical protein